MAVNIKLFSRFNVFWYMTYQGMLNGFLLGAGYVFLFVFVHRFETSIVAAVSVAVMPAVFAGVMASGFGMIMGAANGLLMGAVKQSRHLTHARKKHICYGINLLVIVVTLWLFSEGFRYVDLFFLGLPSIVATGASLLATERHFYRLENQPDARKPKAKRNASVA